MKIILTAKAAMKMRYYTEIAPGEVSGLGKSSINEEGNVVVEDIHLFKQVCTAAHTDINQADQAAWLYNLRRAGEDMTKWNVWWHTHGHIAVSWSPTDTDTIEREKTNNNHLVSIVTNKKGDFLGRVDVFPVDTSPFGVTFKGHKIDATVEVSYEDNMDQEAAELVRQLKEQIETCQEMIKTNTEQISTYIESLKNDESLKCLCEEEVKDKVTSSVPVQTSYNYNNNYASGRQSANYWKDRYDEEDTKKKDETEKRFDDVLFDIDYAIDVAEYEEKDFEGETDDPYLVSFDGLGYYDQFNDVFYCAECGEDVNVCGCFHTPEVKAYINRHKDALSFNNYVKKQFDR